MTSELVVDVQPKEVSIALLEDKQLVELQSEGRNISFSVGNMYLGRVKKLMPGLNACFVDVGYEKDAFLHYLDNLVKILHLIPIKDNQSIESDTVILVLLIDFCHHGFFQLLLLIQQPVFARIMQKQPYTLHLISTLLS